MDINVSRETYDETLEKVLSIIESVSLDIPIYADGDAPIEELPEGLLAYEEYEDLPF